jgi:hypothetical protein
MPLTEKTEQGTWPVSGTRNRNRIRTCRRSPPSAATASLLGDDAQLCGNCDTIPLNRQGAGSGGG